MTGRQKKKEPYGMPLAAPEPVRLKFNGGGLAAFRKSSLPSVDTSKALYLQCLASFRLPFSASLRGKCFSPHFVPCFAVASLRDSPCGSRSVCCASRNPQTENGRGFDSLRHIKRGVVITRVSSPGLSLWWKRVIAMAVFPLDFAVLAMDEELRSLVAADLPPSIDGLLLCVKMTAGPA